MVVVDGQLCFLSGGFIVRRESGFDISDRIHLYVDVDEPVLTALKTHQELLASEVLATVINYSSVPNNVERHQATITEHTVTFGIKRT